MTPTIERWWLASRSLEYVVLRVCERFGWRESVFWELSCDEQIRLLGYEMVRQQDERLQGAALRGMS